MNRRPPPYQGDALPTEPRQPALQLTVTVHNDINIQHNIECCQEFYRLYFEEKCHDFLQNVKMSGTYDILRIEFKV